MDKAIKKYTIEIKKLIYDKKRGIITADLKQYGAIKTKEENVIFERAVSVISVLTWKAGTLPTELLPHN